MSKTVEYKQHNLVLYVNLDYDHRLVGRASDVENTRDHSEYFVELEYSKVKHLTASDIPTDKLIVADLFSETVYEYLEFIEISKTDRALLISAEVNFRLSEWKCTTSPLSFVAQLRDQMHNLYALNSQQYNLFDEDLIHIKFQLRASENETVMYLVNRVSVLLSYEHKAIYKAAECRQRAAEQEFLPYVIVD